MKTIINTSLLSALLLLTNYDVALAGQAKFTESSVDKVKCSKVDGEAFCAVESTGKYSATAYISADTFEQAGITLDLISEATQIDISMGDFSFISTLGEAVNHVLNANKLMAKWQVTHEVCNADMVCKKPAVDTTVTVNASSNGVVIKVTGNSKTTDSDSYGQSIFASTCQNYGDGAPLSEPIYLTVDGIAFTATMTGICKVGTQTKVKNGESFDLNSISAKGTASYLD